jgi:hypothetical protein
LAAIVDELRGLEVAASASSVFERAPDDSFGHSQWSPIQLEPASGRI